MGFRGWYTHLSHKTMLLWKKGGRLVFRVYLTFSLKPVTDTGARNNGVVAVKGRGLHSTQ
jgi:hypothetical protein